MSRASEMCCLKPELFISEATAVLSRYNEVRYSEQRDIVYNFRYFGWFAVELTLKNCGYSELRYIESRVIMNAF
jgi:hypothetical protein